MSDRIRTRAASVSSGRARLVLRRALPLLLLAVGLLMLGASPARAGDNYFERGFEGELGRIAAHEAVYLGKGLLAGILYPGYYGPPRYGPPPYYVPRVPCCGYRGYGPPYGRAVGYWRKHRYPRGCDHGRYERYEEYRDGYGGYERYERRY